MQNRTTATIITVVTAVICGCAGLLACVFGIFGALQLPFQTNVNGVTGNSPMPRTLGIVLLCLSVLFIAVPVGVGFVTLRRKPAAATPSEPIPPAM
jgi:hypothetical protein